MRSDQRLPFHLYVRAFIAGPVVNRIADLVHDSVPDVIVAADKLALATGAVKEMH